MNKIIDTVKVPWEVRLGKIGEDAIEMRLLQFSITAKDQIDVGLDFYCHLLEDIHPSMTYYGIQAKGTAHFDKRLGRSIKKTTVTYWLTRPFPVYIILYEDKDENCYWFSVEDHRYNLIEKLKNTTKKTIYIRINKRNILQKNKNEEFIKKIKEDSVSVELFRGHPRSKDEGYVRRLPDAPRSSEEMSRIKENIRQSMYSLAVFHLQRNELDPAELYCNFLTKFDTAHYNQFLWLGLINKAKGKKTEAKRFLEEALKMCESDKNWSRESIEKIIAYIKTEIQSCE